MVVLHLLRLLSPLDPLIIHLVFLRICIVFYLYICVFTVAQPGCYHHSFLNHLLFQPSPTSTSFSRTPLIIQSTGYSACLPPACPAYLYLYIQLLSAQPGCSFFFFFSSFDCFSLFLLLLLRPNSSIYHFLILYPCCECFWFNNSSWTINPKSILWLK